MSALVQNANESACGHRNLTTEDSLVVTHGGEVLTTSLTIAAKFGKKHCNVLRSILNLDCSPGFSRLNFEERNYLDERGKSQPMYEITRDGFVFLAMAFTGRQAATWKESFINAFNAMERQLLKQAQMHATVDWQNARLAGKVDRHDLTDAVKLLCERAHAREESSTLLHTWVMSATGVVTRILFDVNRESIKCVRDRLTPRQLRNLATAETIYANRVTALLTSDLKHTSINSEAKLAVQTFCAAIGGKQVPGFDRSPMLTAANEIAA